MPSRPTRSLDSTRWRTFLNLTSRPGFLGKLASAEQRDAWSELALRAIAAVDLTLEDLLDERVAEHPERPFFVERGQTGRRDWTYLQIRQRVRGIAATIRSRFGPAARVAIVADNCLEGACADLACLLHDIVVSPLSVHLDAEDTEWILRRIGATVVLVDDDHRIDQLLEIGRRTDASFEVWALREGRCVERGLVPLLRQGSGPGRGWAPGCWAAGGRGRSRS